MIKARGTYFDGKCSLARAATMRCVGNRVMVEEEGGGLLQGLRADRCRIDPPLGRAVRSIRFPGDAVFETADNAAIVALERSWKRNRTMRLVHRIETRWKTVVVSFAGIVLFVWLFHTYAIPRLAKEIAFSLPAGINAEISRHTLKILDSHFMHPTGLDAKRTEGLRKRFRSLFAGLGPDGFDYRLEFRKSPAIGPNAFALPSGTVVMTDELVGISKDDRELDGVLLHEIGHIRGRHALRTVVQNAGVFLIVASLSGDLSHISSTAASLPTVLANSQYSRNFEREADRFAAAEILRRGDSLRPLEDILRRLASKSPKLPGESVLSTHPVTDERIADMEAFSRAQKR